MPFATPDEDMVDMGRTRVGSNRQREEPPDALSVCLGEASGRDVVECAIAVVTWRWDYSAPEARKETMMGLLDILHGMQNEPDKASGGMSKMAMALIALLGYKTLKTGTQPTPATDRDPGVNPSEATSANASRGGIMGGLGDLLKGPLGGILAGASAGSVVNGGLSDLLNQFRQAGHGDVSGSWVGNGPNRPISPTDLTKVLDTDQINTMMGQSGLPRDELLAGLSHQLPRLVDHLTPNGRMPTDEEMSRLV